MAKTFTQLNADYLTLSKDSSTDNTTLGKTLINNYIRKVLSMKDWSFNTGFGTMTTVANQQAYELPYDCYKVRSIRVLNGSTNYFPEEIVDRDDWNSLNRTTTTSDVPTYYHVNEDGQIELYGIPATTGHTIYIYYRKTARNFTASDYTTGTVTLTKGSVYVVGTGTLWTSDMAYRHFSLTDDGFWYEIAGYTNQAYLTLKKAFKGTSVAAGATPTYTIGELVPFPEGHEDIPLWGALAEYFRMRGENLSMSELYEKRYQEGIAILMRTDRRTEGNMIKNIAEISTTVDPNYPPQDLS